MNISIGQYIRSEINDITALKGYVFPCIAVFEDEASVHTPFAVYNRGSMTPDYTKGLWAGSTTHSYSIKVYDDDYTNTLTLAESIINAMMGLSYKVKTDVKFGQITLTSLTESFTDGLYSQELQFEINTETI